MGGVGGGVVRLLDGWWSKRAAVELSARPLSSSPSGSKSLSRKQRGNNERPLVLFRPF